MAAQVRAGGRPRPLAGNSRQKLDSRHQARQPDRRRSQPRRAVAALGAAGGGGKPEAARHRLHRHLPSCQRSPCDATGRDRARDGRSDPPPGQGAPISVLRQLPRLARRRDLQHLRPAPASTVRSSANPITTPPGTACPKSKHFPACGYYGLGIVPYSPLARGVLTGKYRPDAAPDKDSRAGRNDKRMMQTEWRLESAAAGAGDQQARRSQGITAGQFAVSWVLNSSFVSAR